MAVKKITVKAVQNLVEDGAILHLAVIGAHEALVNHALEKGGATEVEGLSNAQLARLSHRLSRKWAGLMRITR